MPPILREVIAQKQDAHHGPPRPVGQRIFVFWCQPCAQFGCGEHGQGLCNGNQADEHKKFYLGVVGSGRHCVLIAPANELHGSKSQDHAEYQNGLDLCDVHLDQPN